MNIIITALSVIGAYVIFQLISSLYAIGIKERRLKIPVPIIWAIILALSAFFLAFFATIFLV